MGSNILERSISLDLYAKPIPDGSRPIILRESLLPGTLTVYQGTALLGPAEYQYVNNAISFSGNDDRSGILIRYQTSSFAKVITWYRRGFLVESLIGPKCIWKRCKSSPVPDLSIGVLIDLHASQQDFELFGNFSFLTNDDTADDAAVHGPQCPGQPGSPEQGRHSLALYLSN